ncbi:MAG: tetratricopeptide repeat protein [Pseudomonadales bacterium]
MKRFLQIGIVWYFALFAGEQALAQRSAPWVGESFDGAPCRGGGQGFGPFDYLQRGGLKQQLYLVESAHFTPEVEQLARGNTGALTGDLDYTLRAWPNHHRALNAMNRYQLRSGASTVSAMRRANIPPAECYLLRAVNFSPKDDMAYMLLGLLSHRKDRHEEALTAYRKAVELSPSNIQAKYNLALLLVDLGQLKEAEALAADVYAAGFPLQGLKRKLSAHDSQ